MREISAERIMEVVRQLCIDANRHLPQDMKNCIEACREREDWAQAGEILDRIMENYRIAEDGGQPICQDTGLACVFLKIGQDVHVDGDIARAVDEGVRQGYGQGYLRKSVVRDPLDRVNTGDNTPAMLYYEIVPGDKLEITVAPKGFGSENVSQIRMLKEAGPNPCPPVVVGVGIGGTFDKAAYLAKKALLRPVDRRNSVPFYARLEEELLEEINALGIGPQGFDHRPGGEH